MSKSFKRITSIVMAILMCLPGLSFPIAAATEPMIADVYFNNDRGTATRQAILSFKGVADINFAPEMVTWLKDSTGDEYMAYCCNPVKPGYSDVTDYPVDLYVFDDTCVVDAGGSGGSGRTGGDAAYNNGGDATKTIKQVVEGCIVYGYPSVSAEELLGNTAASFGVNQDSLNYAAFLATKMAIWSLIHKAYSDINDWDTNTGASAYPDALRKATLKAMQDIRARALNHTSQSAKEITLSIAVPETDGSFYTAIATVGGDILPGRDNYLEVVDAAVFPSTIKVTSMDEIEYAKEATGHRYLIPDGVTKFKIVVPDTKTIQNFKFAFFAATGNKTLLYGKAPNDTVQNYVLAGIGYQGQRDEFDIGGQPTSTPTTTSTPPPSTGEGITIYKYSTNTTEGGARIPLQGVTFELINSLGQSLGTKATDASGTVNWAPLPLGTYHIYERSNNGLAYQLTPPTYQNVMLTVDQPKGIATFYNDPSGKITVIKEDSITGDKIKGIEFELKQIDGNGSFVAVAETDAQGQAIFKDIPDGTYSVREVSTVEPYIKDSTPQTIVVKNGQAPSLKFLNSKYPTLTIQKRDAKTGEVVISPATFHVVQSDGTISFDVVTGQTYKLTGTTTGATGSAATGVANITNLPAGDYVISEKISPAGWVLDTTPQTVHLGADQSIQVVMQNTKTPTLTIEKLGAPPLGDTTGKAAAVPGTVFEVKKLDGTMVGSYTTGTDGTVTIGLSTTPGGYLEPGTYEVTEKSVPLPFLVPTDGSQKQTVVLKAGDTNKLLFTNERKPSLEILKIDFESKKPLANAKIRISRADGTIISEELTDKDGRILLEGLEPQVLSVEEIVAPPDYLLEPQHTDIELTSGDCKQLILTNKAKPKLRIQKVDANTGELLKNSEFRVQLAEGSTVSEYILETGEILLEGLDEKIYRVSEFMPPEGYIALSESKEILLESGVTQTLKFDNVRKPVAMFQKTNGLTGTGVPNTTYKVEYEMPSGGIRNLGSFKTDADGRIIIPKAEVGWYIFTETMPAPGMRMPSNPVTRMYFAAGDNAYLPEMDKYYTSGTGKYASGTGSPITPLAEGLSGSDYYVQGEGFNFPLNSIVLKKADSNTGALLSGAVFELYKADGQVSGQPGTLIGRYVTDASGVVVVVGLESGYFVCKEVQAPPNYLIGETSLQNGFLKPDGTSVLEFTFRNLPYGSIVISKKNAATNEPLANARFKVTDVGGRAVGNLNGEYTTDSHGEVLIPNVAPGAYLVSEISAPPSFVLDPTPKTIIVGTDGGIYKLSFDNYPYSSIVISKKNAITDEPLANARYKVTTAAGEAIGNSNGEYTTNNAGEIVIPNVAPSSVLISELQAPENFALDPTPQTLTVDASGGIFRASFVNSPYGSLLISKTDAITSLPLANARFKVTTADGTVIGNSNGEYVTDSHGEILIPNIAPNTVLVTELQAPPNYAKEAETKSIVIKADGSVHKLSVVNYPYGTLIVNKADKDSKEPIGNTEFKVTTSTGEVVGTRNGFFTTDAMGTIVIPNLPANTYLVQETRANPNYILESEPKTVVVEYGKTATVDVYNTKKGSAQIVKLDASTKQPLKNVQFTVYKASGEVVGTYETDADGVIILPHLANGWYKAVETRSLPGFLLDDTPKDFQITGNDFIKLIFENTRKASLIVKKTDEKTSAPLSGALISISYQDGLFIGDFETDSDGLVIVPTLNPGFVVVREKRAPNGFWLDETPKVVEIKTEVPTVVTLTNKRMTGIQIKKIDEATGAALPGAVYSLHKQNGERIGDTYTTDANGFINIPDLEPNFYQISEERSPEGYLRDSIPKTVEVKTDAPTIVTLTNKKRSGIQIIKVDAETNEPLANAHYTVYKKSGDIIGTYVTDANGVIILDNLDNGWIKIAETRSPAGYKIDETPKDIEIKGNEFHKIVFTNSKLTGIQLRKIDEVTSAALPGVQFTLEKQNGERVGDVYTTDAQGLINITGLEPNWYILREIKTVPGYSIGEATRTVEVKSGAPTIVTVTNKPLAGLKILKLNSENRAPIAGVEFSVSHMSGEKVKNGYNGYTFTTDNMGQITIPNLPDGHYVVVETKQKDGFLLDSAPRTVEVKAGQTTVLEVLNQPASGLLILKSDSITGKPLPGVVYEVRRADGQRVQSSILDGNQPNTLNSSQTKNTTANGDISGSYVTDANGRIQINTMTAGEYHVIETKALPSHEIDTTVHSVTITPGNLATLRLTNVPKAGLRILKLDSISKKGIPDVEFRIYDFNTNKEVGGPYLTDNNGVVDLVGILPAGRYKILETREAKNYIRDTQARTIEFKAGQVLELTWENTPLLGQVQVTKKSASDNEINGLPAGTKLEGAVFEIYDYKTGNVVDQFKTGSNGVGVSKPIPLGRYILKEVVAPKYFKLSDKEVDFDIEFSTQIVKFEFTNEPANTGVSIRKTGPQEVVANMQIRYDFKEVRNLSTVALTDFYYRDILPTDAVRLDKIVTGTFNQSLKYKIMYRTNKNDYRVMADNLSTTRNNVIDARSSALGLKSDEYVTEYMVVFGNVKAGFCQVEAPAVFVTTLKSLPNGYVFTNKSDIGGRYGQEWIIGNSVWSSTVYAPTPGKLPKTGY